MKRILGIIICHLFLLTFCLSQELPGKMRIQIKDRLTGLPLSNTTFSVSLNDSLGFVFISNKDGDAFTPELRKGPYRVSVTCQSYLPFAFYTSIIIGEAKIAYITADLIPARKLTRKEKKAAGL